MRDKGNSFLRVFSILEAVIESPWPLSYVDLSERLALAKPTTHRLCGLLESQHLIERSIDGKKYVPGPRMKSLSRSVLGGSSLQLERRSVLQAVSAKIGETCNLTVPDGTQMLYLDRVETDWPFRISMPVGTRVPLHCTASGKLYLSQITGRERNRLFKSLSLDQLTTNTITDPDALIAELKKTRSNRYGVDNEEFYEGMVAVSVPICDSMGRICATLAVHGPESRLPVEKALSHIPALREAAAQLEEMLGSNEQPQP